MRFLRAVATAASGYELPRPTVTTKLAGNVLDAAAIPLLVGGAAVGAAAVIALMGYGMIHDTANNLRGIRKGWYT